jgi:Chaperone of endosialidase
LRGISYEWKTGQARGQTANRLGLIAQEVRRLFQNRSRSTSAAPAFRRRSRLLSQAAPRLIVD